MPRPVAERPARVGRPALAAAAGLVLLLTGCAGAPAPAATTSATPTAAATSTTATPTPAPAVTPTPTPTPTAPRPPATAAAVISAVPVSQWQRIVAVGAWHPGCPVTRTSLRRVEVNFHGFDGAVHRGVLVVNADVATSVAAIFTQLFARGFPIHRMDPIEAFGGDDNASMAADNTSAYNCRRSSQANAPAGLSPHANGRAVDVNPYENPWVDPRCGCFSPDSRYGRQRTGTGVIAKGGTAWTAFTRAGWTWQDNSTIDYQHFDTGYPSRPLGSPARTTAATVASPTPRATVAPRPAFPVPVTVGSATQVVTVKASGSWATVVAWQRTAAGWTRVLATSAGRVGAHGVVPGATRHQGTDTTPTGTYGLTRAFGILANPGARLPYHRVGPDDWWVEDNLSPWYNTMRTGSQGGFNTSLPESDVNGSERLITHPGQYDYAVVINYNMAPAVRYRGAGIFLHVSGGGATAGCVSVPRSTMVAILRWLDPRAHPVIAIG